MTLTELAERIDNLHAKAVPFVLGFNCGVIVAVLIFLASCLATGRK